METQIIDIHSPDQITQEVSRFQLLQNEVAKVIVGQEEAITFILIGILCNGHVLLEGVPGIAKTTMIKAITKALGLDFKRIQFTPDLLPSDLIGTLIYNPKTQDFETKKGPIFANLILADEINRSPAKVQSALLEAMQENQVTIGSTTFTLEKPFLVFATQNPIEQEGTYQLPEAQVDRFMFKIVMGYPSAEQEKKIILRSNEVSYLQQIISREYIFEAQKIVSSIYIDDRVVDYIVSLIHATRKPEQYKLQTIKKYFEAGASPRATIALYNASKAYAFLKNRRYVTPDDVKAVVTAVLRHRITLSSEAHADRINPDELIRIMLNTVPAP